MRPLVCLSPAFCLDRSRPSFVEVPLQSRKISETLLGVCGSSLFSSTELPRCFEVLGLADYEFLPHLLRHEQLLGDWQAADHLFGSLTVLVSKCGDKDLSLFLDADHRLVNHATKRRSDCRVGNWVDAGLR